MSGFKRGDRVRSKTFPHFPGGVITKTRKGYNGTPDSVWVTWDEGYSAHQTEDSVIYEEAS